VPRSTGIFAEASNIGGLEAIGIALTDGVLSHGWGRALRTAVTCSRFDIVSVAPSLSERFS